MLKSQHWLRPLGLAARYQCTHMPNEPKVVKLQNRSIIRLAGEESRDFIQGLITNDILHVGGAGSSIYSLFLNKSGRVLYDAIIYGSADKGELFVETDSCVAQDLRKHMMIYRIRRKIAIDLVDDEYSVWAAFPGEQAKTLEISDSTADPRVKQLGRRILTRQPDEAVTAILPIGSLKDYNQQRYKLGIAEGVKEIIPGKAFPLEVNCDYMHGLSVHKGCYLGQEFTARTYHTGVVRKRIMPIELKGVPVNLEEDLVNKEVMTAEGKPGGKIRGLEGDCGIGLLRIEMVLASASLKANKAIPVKTWKPSWWPIVAPKGSNNHTE